MEYIKVKDKDNLYRDSYSNGIVNGDYDSYQQYISNYKQKMNENENIKKMKDDIDLIRNDLDDIKNLLKNILNFSNESK